MSVDKLHPSVEKFKLFINAHPELVLEIRRNGDPIQNYYNKWIEYGEDESVWGLNKRNSHETKSDYKDVLDQIVKYAENIDVNKIQGHVKRLNKVLDTLQLMLGDFTGQNNSNNYTRKQTDLFNRFRD